MPSRDVLLLSVRSSHCWQFDDTSTTRGGLLLVPVASSNAWQNWPARRAAIGAVRKSFRKMSPPVAAAAVAMAG